MSQGNRRSAQLRGLAALLLVVSGIAIGIWMGIRGHDYYYPGRLAFDLHERQSSFKAEDVGRYELDYKQELGRLAFDVISPTGERITVEEFGILTRLYHTMGRQGHAFHTDHPGTYQVSVQPWPTGAKVHLSYTNTQAVARWCFGGKMLSGLSCGLAALILLRMVRSKKKARSESTETPDATAG